MKKFVIIFACLLTCVSLFGCGNSSGNSDGELNAESISAAKTREEAESGNGAVLDKKDVASFVSIVAESEKETEWVHDTISNSIPACYLKIDDAIFTYSDMGVLDDQTNFKSLTLTDDAKAKIDEILSKYVELMTIKRIDRMLPEGSDIILEK